MAFDRNLRWVTLAAASVAVTLILVPRSGTTAPAPSAEVQLLQERISALEQRVIQLEKKRVTSLSANGARIEITPTGEVRIESPRRVSMRSGNQVEVEATGPLSLKGGYATTLSAGSRLELKGGHSLSASAPGDVEMKASRVRLNGGQKPVARKDDRVENGKISQGSGSVFVP